MKKLFVFLMVVVTVMMIYAQSTELDNTTDTDSVYTDTGRLLLREISVTTLDDPTVWDVNVPFDKGFPTIRRFVGSPLDKAPLRVEEQINEYNPADDYVLGVKVEFYGRDYTYINIDAKKPFYVPGIVKTLSIWVSGRSKQHRLSVHVRDMTGHLFTLPLGLLNFEGWQKMEIAIPPNLIQENINGRLTGLYLEGFQIDTEFTDTVGSYYIYFDDVRAISDVIEEAIDYSTGVDDISDAW